MSCLYFLINSLAGGGAEKVLLRLLDYIQPRRVFLVERDVEYRVNREILKVLSSHSKSTNPVIKTICIPLYAFRLSQEIQEDCIVLSFLERANYVNIFSKVFKRHRAIISVRMDQLTGHVGVRRLNHLLSKLLYPRADLCVAVSCGVKESLLKLGIPEEKIKVIYNPYPVEEIQQKAKEEIEEVFKSFPYIITAGRLTKPKGQWYLLRVFRELKKDFPELRLLILGDGELKDYLYDLSQRLGLKTYLWDRDELSENFDVYFLGFKENPFKYISRAKLFVFPSLWEGFPNALVEAMACGVCVVSSDCRSGPREILAPDTDFRHQTDRPEFARYGVLMPVFEVKYLQDEPLSLKEMVWVDTLRKLLEDDALREDYSKRSKERAMDFHVNKIVQEWRRVFDEVLR